jgi:hypothetical protein
MVWFYIKTAPVDLAGAYLAYPLPKNVIFCKHKLWHLAFDHGGWEMVAARNRIGNTSIFQCPVFCNGILIIPHSWRDRMIVLINN